MSSITLNFTINIDSALLRTLLAAAAREIQLNETIDPASAASPAAPSPPTDVPAENTVVQPEPEPQALPEPAPVPLITNERKPVFWKKKIITLVDEEELLRIVNRIEMGEISSSTLGVNWYTKHHPLKGNTLKIVEALRKSSNRNLSFQSLLAQTPLMTTGLHSLQNYLREMDKQGIITYSPKD